MAAMKSHDLSRLASTKENHTLFFAKGAFAIRVSASPHATNWLTGVKIGSIYLLLQKSRVVVHVCFISFFRFVGRLRNGSWHKRWGRRPSQIRVQSSRELGIMLVQNAHRSVLLLQFRDRGEPLGTSLDTWHGFLGENLSLYNKLFNSMRVSISRHLSMNDVTVNFFASLSYKTCCRA